jgi:hypothetical protein
VEGYGKVFVRASREASNFELSHRADVAEVLSDAVGLVAISDIGARDTLLALVPALNGHLPEIRPGSLQYPRRRRRWRCVYKRQPYHYKHSFVLNHDWHWHAQALPALCGA